MSVSDVHLDEVARLQHAQKVPEVIHLEGAGPHVFVQAPVVDDQPASLSTRSGFRKASRGCRLNSC